MRKIALLLAVILLLGCLAGCHQQPVEGTERSIENEDGTLSDWMTAEIKQAWEQKHPGSANFTDWWSPEHPNDTTTMYLGTYNGYIMYSSGTGCESLMKRTIAGYVFEFSSLLDFCAYKDGEFYDLMELLNQGLIDEEAIRIAHEHFSRINEIITEYKNRKNESSG